MKDRHAIAGLCKLGTLFALMTLTSGAIDAGEVSFTIAEPEK